MSVQSLALSRTEKQETGVVAPREAAEKTDLTELRLPAPPPNATTVKGDRVQKDSRFSREFTHLDELQAAFSDTAPLPNSRGRAPMDDGLRAILVRDSFESGRPMSDILNIFYRVERSPRFGTYISMHFAGYELNTTSGLSAEQMIGVYDHCLRTRRYASGVCLDITNIVVETRAPLYRVLTDFSVSRETVGRDLDIAEFSSLYKLYALGWSLNLREVLQMYDDLRKLTGASSVVALTLTSAALRSHRDALYVSDFYKAAVGTIHPDPWVEASFIRAALIGGRYVRCDIPYVEVTIIGARRGLHVEEWQFDRSPAEDVEYTVLEDGHAQISGPQHRQLPFRRRANAQQRRLTAGVTL